MASTIHMMSRLWLGWHHIIVSRFHSRFSRPSKQRDVWRGILMDYRVPPYRYRYSDAPPPLLVSHHPTRHPIKSARQHVAPLLPALWSGHTADWNEPQDKYDAPYDRGWQSLDAIRGQLMNLRPALLAQCTGVFSISMEPCTGNLKSIYCCLYCPTSYGEHQMNERRIVVLIKQRFGFIKTT